MVVFRRQRQGCHQVRTALHIGGCIKIEFLESVVWLSCPIDLALAFSRHQADHEVGISYYEARDALDGSRGILNDDGVSPEKLDRD